MRKRVKRLADRLWRKGFRRGIAEGSGAWLAIGSVALLVRALVQQDKPRTVTEQLRVGESLVVTHLPAPPRGRKAKRASGA